VFFQSGALIVKDNQIIAQHEATPFPKSNLHSDSKCIDEAMEKANSQLEGFTLYSSMEPLS
jgi:tRNA(Arg) A34 adenosine deaminase TadA